MAAARPKPHRGAIPWGLVGLVGLVIAVESLAAAREVDLTSGVVMDWALTRAAAGREARACEVLCFGSSMVKLGVQPGVVRARSGRSVYNLALLAGSPPSSFFLLRRALDAGARPAAVVVDFQPASLRIQPELRESLGHWSVLLGPRDCWELAWDARDARLFLAATATRALPSLRHRRSLRDGLLAALDGRGASGRLGNLTVVRNEARNAGAQAMGRNPGFRGEIPADPPLFQPWGCDPLNATYTRKFLDLADRSGIPVVWVIPPYAPKAQERLARLGIDAPFDRLLDACQARHPGLVVVDARRSGYPAEVFADHVHLDRRGAAVFSDDLVAALTRPPGGVGRGSRRIALPAFRDRAIDAEAGVEDHAQSYRAVVLGTGSSVRR